MNSFILATRTFFKKGRSNTTKVLTLGAGLALGLALLSKVLFVLSYDNFYPDSENIYLVKSYALLSEDKPEEWGQVSGAVAPGLSREVPGVLESTRFTYISGTSFVTENRSRFNAVMILADSNFYNILPRPMVAGDVSAALTNPLHCIVSESIAKKMGGSVLGKQFEPEAYPGLAVTIAGVFEDLPENSSFKYDVAISLSSIGSFLWDGRENWLGNDRYRAFVRLSPGTDPESLAPDVRKMQERNQDMETLKKAGVDLTYRFSRFRDEYKSRTDISRMNYLMGFLAFILIATSVFNYILISVTTLASRSKEIAVYKCHGANKKQIAALVMSETALHLVISLVFSAVLILSLRSYTQELLAVTLESLFNLKTILVLSVICLVILIVAVVIPVNLFSNVPVSSVMKEFKMGGMHWKKILLFIQITFSSFLLTTLVLTSKQYRLLLESHPGYESNNLLYFSSDASSSLDKTVVMQRLLSMPQVKGVSASDALLTEGQSGNNVFLPGDDRELFNIADLYNVSDNYIEIMEIPVVAGIPPGPGYVPESDVMVSRSFAEKLSIIAGWEDGALGKSIIITEHGLCNIKGIFENILIGSLVFEDKRPSAMFYNPEPGNYVLIKTFSHHDNYSGDFNSSQDSVYNVIDNEIASVMPERNYSLRTYKSDLLSQYRVIYNFRNALLIGVILSLVITVTGLSGYINNEIYRRRLEISMRKICGASNLDIYLIFTKQLLLCSIPSALIGIIATSILAPKVMELFSEKAVLPITMYFVIFLIIQLITIFPKSNFIPRIN